MSSRNKSALSSRKSLPLAGALLSVLLYTSPAAGQQADSVSMRMDIEEVVVSNVRRQADVRISSVKMNRLPTLLGEKDVLKYIATLPGVSTTGLLDPGIYVRGGNSIDNAFLVNDIDVLSPQHLTGVISMFDPFVLDNVVFYKSGYPARYNDHLSSFINMGSSTVGRDSLRGELSVGLLSAALKMKGPIVKDKVTFAASARTSYFRHIAALYNKASDGETMPSYSFSDITANLTARLAPHWTLSAFGMYSWDRLKLDPADRSTSHNLRWQTANANVRVQNSGEKGLLTLAAGGNYYKSGMNVESFLGSSSSRYQTLTALAQYDFYIRNNLTLQAGAKASFSGYSPGGEKQYNFGIYRAYADLNYRFWGSTSVEAGLNYQYYAGDADASTLSPRFKLNYGGRNWNVWADYAKTVQYNSLFPYFTLKSPIDITYPMFEGMKPAVSHHYSIGADWQATKHLYLYAALFYKDLRRQKDFLSVMRSQQAEVPVHMTEGEGSAKGIETNITYETGRLFLRVNYTLSESVRRFAEINGGREFHPPFDVKHNVLAAATLELGSRWAINAMWTYCSGGYATFPVSVAVVQDINSQKGSTVYVPIYRDRYNFKLPDNHRLDVSVDYTHSLQRCSMRWSAGIYNLYNRQNPSFIYYRAETRDKYYTQFVPHYKVLLPFIPYISLNVSW